MRVRIALAVPILACLLVTMAVRADSKEKVDYQKLADKYRWDFDAQRCDVVHSMGQVRGYDVSLRYSEKTDNFWHYTLTISRDQKDIFTWDAHPASVFQVRNDVLYAADYSPIATGATIFAVDLKTGKELWRSDVQGVGPVSHSKYRNAINFDLVDGAVRIVGDESFGRYVEFKDIETGQTVGHRKIEEVDT